MIDLFRMVHLSLCQADDQYILKSVFQQEVIRCLGSGSIYDMITWSLFINVFFCHAGLDPASRDS
jgi:hypothetical protein